MIFPLLLATALGPGTDVKLHVTDAHGRPKANREIWLQPTNSTKPVRPFGVQWIAPDNDRYMHGLTDAKGNVTIHKAKWRTPLMVITRFGPRFDPYVARSHANDPPGYVYQHMDVMKMEGAVYAGGSAHIVIADDYEIVGRVTDFKSGDPLPNVPVYLEDTDFGHMGGYPLTDLDDTKTDAGGNFAFTNLPNCNMTVEVRPNTPYGIEARVDNKKWKPIAVYGGPDHFYGSWGTWVLLNKPISRCDFRISKPARLTIKVSGGSLDGWSVNVDDEGGLDLSGASTFTEYYVPGAHEVWFERNSDYKRFNAARIRLSDAEKRTLDLRLPHVAKRR